MQSFRAARKREPGISRFRVRCFASPRNDGPWNPVDSLRLLIRLPVPSHFKDLTAIPVLVGLPRTRSSAARWHRTRDVAVNEAGVGTRTDSGAIRSGLVPELKQRPRCVAN